METRLVLKRKWKVSLAIILLFLLGVVMKYAVKNYAEYLNNCDKEKGYTCNIFGK